MAREPKIWMNRLGFGGENQLVRVEFKQHLPESAAECVTIFSAYKSGALTNADELPPSGVLHNPKRKFFADAFYIGPFVIVSARARAVLEGFDLGGGWFSPFTIFRRPVEPVEGEFFILNVAAKKRAVIMREPEMRPDPAGDDGCGGLGTRWEHKVPIRPSAIEGADLWQDVQLYPADVFFYSDRLYLAIRRAKLSGFVFYKTVIEAGWVPRVV